MKLKEINNIFKALMKNEDEIVFYMNGKQIEIKEIAIDMTGEHKVIFVKKKKKLFWKGNKK